MEATSELTYLMGGQIDPDDVEALFQLGFQQYFIAEDVKGIVERSSGSTLTYEVTQDDEERQFEIAISRFGPASAEIED